MKTPEEIVQQGSIEEKRPDWFHAWLDYPHGGLNEKQARQICWYACRLENERAAIQADREERVHKMDWRLEEHARQMRLRAERELAARVMQNEANRHAVVVRGRGRPRKDGGPRRQLQPWEKRRAQYLDEVGRTEP